MARPPLIQSATAPRWSPRSAPVVLEGRALLVFASLVGLALGLVVLDYRGLEFAAFTLFVIAIQVALVLLAQWQIRRFDARYRALMEEGDIAGLRALIDHSEWVRLVAPRGWFSSREGRVRMLQGDWEAAETALELAWASTHLESRAPLIPLLCRTKYHREAWGDLVQLARDWVRVSPAGPGIWYVLWCELQSMESAHDTEIAMRLVSAPDVSDPTDVEVRARVSATL